MDHVAEATSIMINQEKKQCLFNFNKLWRK